MGQQNLFGSIDDTVEEPQLSKTAQTRLEQNMRGAYQRRDSVAYFNACDALGLAEDQYDRQLYGLGEMGLQLQDIKPEPVQQLREPRQRQRYVTQATIDTFLRESGQVGDNPFQFHEHHRVLLAKFFPNRFGSGGSQDLARYDRSSRGKGQVARIFIGKDKP
jgi:hypothetical protein